MLSRDVETFCRKECLGKRQREAFETLARVWLFPEAWAFVAVFRFSWPALVRAREPFLEAALVFAGKETFSPDRALFGLERSVCLKSRYESTSLASFLARLSCPPRARAVSSG